MELAKVSVPSVKTLTSLTCNPLSGPIDSAKRELGNNRIELTLSFLVLTQSAGTAKRSTHQVFPSKGEGKVDSTAIQTAKEKVRE